MSEILVTLEGYGIAKLSLDLIDGGEPDDNTEVWKATFTESENIWEVYFEMNTEGYELWDLVNEAIFTYRMETEQ
jgi:hypothetical protein